MVGDLEYKLERKEALFSVVGPGAAAAMTGLFGRPLEPAQLEYVDWADGAPRLAACWFPPDRLEVRVPAEGGWPERMAERLRTPAAGSFPARLDALVARPEAWTSAVVQLATRSQHVGNAL